MCSCCAILYCTYVCSTYMQCLLCPDHRHFPYSCLVLSRLSIIIHAAHTCTASPPHLLSLATMTSHSMRVCALGQRSEHAQVYSPVLVSCSLHSSCACSSPILYPRLIKPGAEATRHFNTQQTQWLMLTAHAPCSPLMHVLPSFPHRVFHPPANRCACIIPFLSPPQRKRAQSITPCEEPRPAAEL